MTIRITDHAMTSSLAPAVRADRLEHAATDGRETWIVTGDSRLAARTLTRDDAISALTLAEAEAAGRGGSPHAHAWRAELGISPGGDDD